MKVDTINYIENTLYSYENDLAILDSIKYDIENMDLNNIEPILVLLETRIDYSKSITRILTKILEDEHEQPSTSE